MLSTFLCGFFSKLGDLKKFLKILNFLNLYFCKN